MATKPKSIEVISKHLTIAEKEARKQQETKLKEALSDIQSPSWLGIKLKRRFNWYVSQYSELDLLTILDANILARYVVYEARFIELEELIRKQSFTLDDGTKINPLLVEQRQVHDKMEKLESKLGMNPSDRLRFAVPQEEETDELDAFRNELR
ncbi:phage terminase small subunit P27 family [Peribacillus sp. NPDC097675]|uniref:phage terminase small subunit P27 family n=1 Tax=Peribacillus sp. NPDC097675 TaxID=3390618 RepID=UPI003D05CA0F